MNLFPKQKETHKHKNKLMVTMGEWRVGEGINREVGFNIYHYIQTSVHKITNKDLLYNIRNYTQYSTRRI